MVEKRTCLNCGRTYLAPNEPEEFRIPDLEYCSEYCAEEDEEVRFIESTPRRWCKRCHKYTTYVFQGYSGRWYCLKCKGVTKKER